MRILLGLWLLQALTVAPVWLFLTGHDPLQVGIAVAAALGAGLLMALWIGTLLRDQRRLSEAKSSERLATARAKFNAALAKHKTEEAARLSALTRKFGNARTRLLKLGLLTGGTLGLGAALMIAQVFTAGLLIAAFTGGGAVGYGLRAAFARRAAREPVPAPPVIDMIAEEAGTGKRRKALAAGASGRNRGARLRLLRPAKQ